MSIRRLFWLGAAVLFVVAAVVAIGAVLGGDLGRTQWNVLGTCAIAFVTGSTALAGLVAADRGAFRPVGVAAMALGIASFALWTGGLWSEADGDPFWKLAGVVGTWMLAALVVTTLRLLSASRPLSGSLVAATMGTACLAAFVGSGMIVAASTDAWQLLAVLMILTVLGYFLAPILRRFSAAAAPPAAEERVLGSIGSVDVFAVRGDARSVRIGDRAVELAVGESVVLRPRT